VSATLLGVLLSLNQVELVTGQRIHRLYSLYLIFEEVPLLDSQVEAFIFKRLTQYLLESISASTPIVHQLHLVRHSFLSHLQLSQASTQYWRLHSLKALSRRRHPKADGLG